MKLALIIKHIANGADATRWITNFADIRYKGLSDDVLLVFYAGSEDELIQKLRQGLSGESSFALYTLNGTFHGLGNAENAAQQIHALFDN